MTATLEAPSGLEGLVVTTTAIGDVRGEEGYFHYRGHDATELARHHSLEEVWHLLVVGHLPDATELDRFTRRIGQVRRQLPAALVDDLAALATGSDGMANLRTLWSHAAAALDCRPWGDLSPSERLDQALALSAIGPVLVAASHGIRADVAELPDGTAAALLSLVDGAAGDPQPGRAPAASTPDLAARTAALERYLVLTLDHGLNASTFTARTVASTGADLGAVLVAALGALSGPLHGGAPSRALDMLDAIGTADRAEAWVRDTLARGERIMGFGHRIYRTEDPRARLLRDTARDLGGPRIDLALHVEEVVRRLLREAKPDRVLDVNVEYHAAIVLDGVGLPRTMFTPTFAMARSIGWMAHALEQMEGNRIVRPSSRYEGPSPQPSAA
jgi:citrate synthase